MKVVAVFVLSAGLVLGAACTDQRQELMEQLVDRSPVKRAAAVRSLPSEGGEDAYMLVTKALTDHSTIVRIAAVHALADIKDRDTTAAMIRATRDADPEVRQVAVAKLVAHNKGKAKTVLMNMLLNGEPNIQVRQNIYSELSRLDLSGEKLAEQMVISRIGKINEVWDKSMPAQRVRLVLEAGRLYHADGVGIVLRGLADSDAAVAMAAMAAVDGRGGKQALRLLIKLASDQSEKIRMAAVGSLSKYGSDGLVVLKGALRDVEPNVRTAALREITKISGKLDPALACSLLEVKEEKTLIEVIGLLKTQGIECPLTTFASWLENPELELYQTAINVLAASANDEARGLLKAEFKKRPANLKPMLGVALARSGDSSAQLAKYLKGELKKFLDDFDSWSQGWVADKLPPTEEAAVEKKDTTRLSDEQLKKLYEKHGLPKASKNAPRGVSDLLASYEDKSEKASATELFESIDDQDLYWFSLLFDGLILVDAAGADALIKRCLLSADFRLVGLASQLLFKRKIKVGLKADAIGQLGKMILETPESFAFPIVDFLGSTQTSQVVEALGGLLKEASWEKREKLIETLGSVKKVEALVGLHTMLEGYSASSAAKALGIIGDKSSVDPLKLALERAGPSAEMDILLALAQLGNTDILPRLSEKLIDQNPDMRRMAVRIIGALGQPFIDKYLSLTKFDLDRFVRHDVEKFMNQ